ncbi:MAG: excinuclease ABC subunit UvrC [Flavobacteriales bacterium]|nr:excinuclease ABC subunit UvrC [Flavobacteriales bacterium]
MEEDLKQKVSLLPDSPGVYQYFDIEGKLLYVGKAKNLKKRVSSYFNKEHDSGRITIMVSKIVDLKVIVTETELDALLLENNLIKNLRPRYNVMLRDDKTYPWICISNEAFPRVYHTRRKEKDGSSYFGPYANVKMMWSLLELIRQMYPIRSCQLNLSEENIAKKKFKVCLEYHIGNCKGPCEAKQSEEEYDEMIADIRYLIKGNTSQVLKQLREKMKIYSQELAFEKAQELKTKIDILENYRSKFTVVSSTVSDVDVFSIVNDDKFAYVNYFRVIDGSIVQSHTLEIKKMLDEPNDEILTIAITELRQKFQSDAKEIIVPFELEYDQILVTVPQRGDKKQLLELSERNARYYMMDKHRQESVKDPERSTERILETMKKDLRLTELPRHIECFDNSNIQGTNPVSACVVFKNAKPSKKDYRHFNVKTVEGPDDFATMEEVIFRRYSRLLEEKQELPQLIVIDGGKGQLGAALNSLEKLGLRGKIAIVGIAKRLEEIYYPGDSLPLYIDKRSESLKVIQHMRNEAHRFGITHHRNRRSKGAIQSELTSIPGIGEKTMEQLMKVFKSLKRLKEAEESKIAEVIGPAKTKVLLEYFNSLSKSKPG